MSPGPGNGAGSAVGAAKPVEVIIALLSEPTRGGQRGAF